MIFIKRLLIPLLVFLPAFEFTVRVDDLARFGVPLDSRVTMLEDLLVTDSVGQHARPSSTFQKFHINSLGFRGAEISDSALHSRPLIVVSGASESFGLYETAGREWPRQLADSLDRRCWVAPVTVLNAAIAGMSLPTVIQDVQLRLVPLKPKVIVYYPSPSGYLRRGVPRPSRRAVQPPGDLSPWRSRALPRVRDALRNVVPERVLDYMRRADTRRLRASGETLFPSLPVERLDSLEAHLRMLVGTARRGHAEVVLVLPYHRFADTSSMEQRRWLRAWERQVPKASGAILLSFSEMAGARVRAVAADSAVPLVDPALAMHPERAILFADPTHLTDRGAAIVAGGVAASVAPLLGCTSFPLDSLVSRPSLARP
jgi:lysophospholipase L1-like esterase